ncbi:MAG: hypothetical protein NUV54_03165, partial [Candidatus Taylorbacteria bacterium]|nr:hypothetical protein [Candidatus Taylorbacteria bacterium]
YQDLERLRDNLMQAQEKLFDVGLYISIYGKNEEELDKVESEVKSILEAKLIYLKPALFQQEQGFRSVMPIASDELMVHSKLNSSPLSSLFPFTSFDLTSDKGILYGINRHNSSLVLFDRFALENYNSITFAKSGSGKSIVGNEPVLIRKNGLVSLAPIGQVVENVITERGAVKIDDELEGVIDPNLEVYAFDKNLKGKWSKITVAARKDAPEELYRFRTQSGREVVTTADHNLVVLQNGKIIVAKSSEVSEGMHVPLPRKIEASKNPLSSLNLLKLFASEKELYILGAENLTKKCVMGTDGAHTLDRYLYRYRDGRRIPVPYALKLFKQTDFNIDAPPKKWFIGSASGKSVLPALMPITPALLRLLGYITSEGTTMKNKVNISNTDETVLTDIKVSLGELNTPFFATANSVVISSKPFVELGKTVGVTGTSATKRVPGFIFGLDTKDMAEYLRAYFEGDGGVDGPAVTAVSKSKNLISDLAYLLLFFGIIARIHRTEKLAPGHNKKGEYWQLSISGQEYLNIFARDIGFVTERKKALLATTLGKHENTNVDIIPEIKSSLDELENLLGGALGGISALTALRNERYSPSPSQLRKVIALVEKRLIELRELETVVAKLAHLPSLEALIRAAEMDASLNRKLWQTLGSSWATIKNGMVFRGKNASVLLNTTGHQDFSDDTEIKNAVTEGFAVMGLHFKTSGFSNILGQHQDARSSYDTLKRAADFIEGQYRNLSSKLPQAEAIIGTLRKLCDAELFWDPIVEIKGFKNKTEKYVYDLTVDSEVFVAGNAGMFVHNSYNTKLEILRTLMFDTEVIVIDPEREYEYMAEATGGKYFTISLNSSHHINPFDLPVPREDESSSDVLRSNIINLVGLFRIMLGGLTPEEDAIIDRAISETYALKDITPDSDFRDIEPPLLSDFELVLAGMEGGDSLVQRLSKYTRGTWAGFINKPSNIDIDAKFIVFSLRDMEDELKPVAMYIVTHYIWNAIRKNLRKRLLVIDEAWWMMKSEDTASFLLGLAKRGRKYYLGLSTITQDVDDFLKSPYGLPIITNSSIQMLLKQSPSSIDKIQKVFNLTDEEKYLLLESDVGEGIFFVGLKHVAIKVIASYTEDQIITSDPSQLLSMKKAKKELEDAEGQQDSK